MTTINLLPWRAKVQKQQKQQFFIFCLAAVIVALLLNTMWWVILNKRIDAQYERNNLLQQEIQQSKLVLNKKKKFNLEQQDLMSQLHTIQDLHNQRYRVVELLGVLPKLLPNDVNITAIDLEKQKVGLQGEAPTDTQISELIKKLKQQPGWSNIRLSEIAADPTEVNKTTFHIDLTLE